MNSIRSWKFMNTEYRIVFVTSKSTNTEYRIVFVTSKSTNTEYRIVLFGPNYSRIPNNRIIRCNSARRSTGRGRSPRLVLLTRRSPDWDTVFGHKGSASGFSSSVSLHLDTPSQELLSTVVLLPPLYIFSAVDTQVKTLDTTDSVSWPSPTCASFLVLGLLSSSKALMHYSLGWMYTKPLSFKVLLLILLQI